LLFAVVAALFDFLPDARHPYAPSNLVVTFAAVSAGPIAGTFASVGAIITAILLVNAASWLPPPPPSSSVSPLGLWSKHGHRCGRQPPLQHWRRAPVILQTRS
jgi:hypothetical protein